MIAEPPPVVSQPLRRAPVTAPQRERPAWASFEHRPAIDGLRAVAALLVVLFHAGLPGLGNGFVGVDVFFVLSGFLITSLLAREVLADRRVQMVRFYARRARRLFPVAMLVLLVTAVLYVQFAPPLAVYDNRSGFPAAALYVSNWLFMAQSQDYFAEAASPSPVLHYWSLSVEEQFYLVWPLLLLALMAIPVVRRRWAPLLVAVLAGGALLGSAWLSTQDPSAAYFSTLARAYQLLIGATLALACLWLARTGNRPPRPLGALAPWLLGIGVVVVVAVATDYGPANPWWVGVIGCLATAAILGGMELGGRGPVGRLLQNPVARWLGIWSYAIYLWHWPVIVLGDLAGWLPPQWWARVPLVTGVTILLSALSWLVIERPAGLVRMPRLKQQRRVVLVGLTVTLATALACTALLWPSQLTQSLVAAAEEGSTEQGGVSVSAGSNDKSTVMLIGDSHALSWVAGLKAFAKKEGFRFVSVTQVACPWAAVDAIDLATGERFRCDQDLRQPALAALRKYRPEVTLLVSRSITVRDVRAEDGSEYALGSSEWESEVRAGMTEFLGKAQPYTDQLVIVEPLPETSSSMLECLSTGASPSDCDQPQEDRYPMQVVEDVQRSIAGRTNGVASVSLDSLVCPDGWCRASVDGMPTHRDNHHMTDGYAGDLVPRVSRLLRERGIELTGEEPAESG